MTDELVKSWCQRVKSIADQGGTIGIKGSASKIAYYPCKADELIEVADYAGVISYDPTELVIKAKAGTPLLEVNHLLSENGQCFRFEPLRVNNGGTLGGMLATGLSGSRAAFSGGIRDYVLGGSLINGRGEFLEFGGQVMKNVAGYDVSRMLVGSLGKLGVITDLSLKVLPKEELEKTVSIAASRERMIEMAKKLARRMSPVTAVAHDGSRGLVRLSGRKETVEEFFDKSVEQLGFDCEWGDSDYWDKVNQLSHPVISAGRRILLISLPKYSDLKVLEAGFEGAWLMDWAGARYWVSINEINSDNVGRLLEEVRNKNGHIRELSTENKKLFQSSASDQVVDLNWRLSEAYDPCRIFNPGIKLFG